MGGTQVIAIFLFLSKVLQGQKKKVISQKLRTSSLQSACMGGGGGGRREGEGENHWQQRR